MNQDGLQHIIEKTANAFGIDCEQIKKKERAKVMGQILQSEREEEPLNEFTEMEELLTGAFPSVFLFGTAYSSKSTLSSSQVEHLLLQFTNEAATNKELLFYLYDCQQRHKVINNFALKVRKDPVTFSTYAVMIRNKEFCLKERC